MWTALLAALDLFRTQKMRFLLTVSGIVVGVGSLVVMASLLEVGQDALRSSSAEALGDDLITVENDWRAISNNPDARMLDRSDVERLERSVLLPSERTVLVEYGPEEHKALLGDKELVPFVMGVSADVFEVRRLQIAKGRPFTADEYRNQRRVLIAGAHAADGKIAPGNTLRIEGTPFLVVGVMAEKPDMGPGGRFSWNNRLLMPASTYKLEFAPGGDPGRIVVRVRPPVEYTGALKDFVLGARDLMDVVLARGKTVKSWRFEGVSDDSSTEALIFRTIKALLYLTTVFSMIVGGINIMNIMLVTVAERTREIGTRRALGATQGDILRQFLAETVMVTLLGSAIGLVGAAVIVVIGSLLMDAYVVEWPIRFVPWSIGGGVGFSGLIGLTFGMFPAWRASRLDPVEALRYE